MASCSSRSTATTSAECRDHAIGLPIETAPAHRIVLVGTSNGVSTPSPMPGRRPDRLALSVVHNTISKRHCRTNGRSSTSPSSLHRPRCRTASSSVSGFIDDLDRSGLTILLRSSSLSSSQPLGAVAPQPERAGAAITVADATEHGRDRGTDPRIPARGRALLSTTRRRSRRLLDSRPKATRATCTQR